MRRFGILVLFAVFLGSCGTHNPAASPRVEPEVEVGIWTGEMKANTCTRVSGSGKDTCGSMVSTVHPIRLVLRRAGSEVRGTLQLFRDGPQGPIKGTFLGTSAASITGTLSRTEDGIVVELHPWQLLTVDTSIQAGTLALRNTFDNIFGRQVREETYEVLRLDKVEG